MERTVAILAGGQSRRMGGRDKALVLLGGARLIDHAIKRFVGQAGAILISGSIDYGTGLTVIRDEYDLPKGPAGGVFAVARWLRQEKPSETGFFTAPVDGPFAPVDLLARLGAAEEAAIAVDDAGVHPTFAYWRLDALDEARQRIATADKPSVSLHALAEACSARKVRWPGEDFFANINTMDDLKKAEYAIALKGK